MTDLTQLMLKASRLLATKPDRLLQTKVYLTISEVYAPAAVDLVPPPPVVKWVAGRRAGEPASDGYRGDTPEEALTLLVDALKKEIMDYLGDLETSTTTQLDAIQKAKRALEIGDVPAGALPR